MSEDEVIALMGQELFTQGDDVPYGDQVRAILTHAEKHGYVLVPKWQVRPIEGGSIRTTIRSPSEPSSSRNPQGDQKLPD